MESVDHLTKYSCFSFAKIYNHSYLGMFRFRQAGTTFEGSGVVSLKTDTITSANKPVMFRAPAMMACAA